MEMPYLIAAVVVVIFSILIVQKVVGMVFKVISITVTIAIIYLLYKLGVDEMIMAPGNETTKLIASMIF